MLSQTSRQLNLIGRNIYYGEKLASYWKQGVIVERRETFALALDLELKLGYVVLAHVEVTE